MRHDELAERLKKARSKDMTKESLKGKSINYGVAGMCHV